MVDSNNRCWWIMGIIWLILPPCHHPDHDNLNADFDAPCHVVWSLSGSALDVFVPASTGWVQSDRLHGNTISGIAESGLKAATEGPSKHTWWRAFSIGPISPFTSCPKCLSFFKNSPCSTPLQDDA